MRKLAVLLFVLMSLLAPALVMSQTEAPALVLYTNGLFDSDESVLYSVFVASPDENSLAEVTVASTLPEGATFVEAVWTPEGAEFVGESEGVVSWTLPELAGDTISGPFTYRVTFADATIPLEVNALIRWQTGELAYTPQAGDLVLFEDSGSITIEAAGTGDFVPVGNTGVWVNAPEGAVASAVTITFERLPFTEETSLPTVEDSIWWCTLFQITFDAPDALLQPIAVLYPTRRALTPGLPVVSFIKTPDGEWQPTEPLQSSAAPGFLKPLPQRYLTELVTSVGNVVSSQVDPLINTNLSSFVYTGGVSEELRAQSATSFSETLLSLMTLGEPQARFGGEE